MPVPKTTVTQLCHLSKVAVEERVLLSAHTRFGIGGPADVYMETASEPSLTEALEIVRESGCEYTVIGDGTNLIVSDAGFRGIVLRFTNAEIQNNGNKIQVAAGASLQNLVDYCVERGFRGLETMTGIPGSVGAAVYGNAGAYGHSINERIRQVRFINSGKMCVFENAACEFRYRESIFKRHKEWTIVSADFEMDSANAAELHKTASDILRIRLEKYPPTMKCAGSIFKNLILADLPDAVRRQVPEQVVREGKVASAYFLEQVGAKGMEKGGIRVADYHANLIYNAGQGTASELCQVIEELKSRVQRRFGLALEEEVQYVGFSPNDRESESDVPVTARSKGHDRF